MLTGKDLSVLKTLLEKCGEKNGCLIEKEELLSLLKDKKTTSTALENALDFLQVEGYFEIIKCVKNGRDAYCVFPKLKARCYRKERREFIVGVALKIGVALLGSALAFVLSKILYGLF